MLSLVISTVAFFVAAWYVKRYLDELEIPKGLTRGVLVFTLSAAAAWGAGAAINWLQGKPVTPKIPAQVNPISEP
jgi:hypothetical protein